MKNFDEILIILHDQIDYDRSDILYLFREFDELFLNDEYLPEYTLLLYQNYISLSELSFSIKEYFVLKGILIHKF